MTTNTSSSYNSISRGNNNFRNKNYVRHSENQKNIIKKFVLWNLSKKAVRELAILPCFLLSISNSLWSQNLVTNPSFETLSSCPTSVAQVDRAIGWDRIATHSGTPDLLHACNLTPIVLGCPLVGVPCNIRGNQAANTGDGYVFMAVYLSSTSNFREYIFTQLSSPMIAGREYCVSFYASLADKSNWSSDNALEVYFSTAPVSGTGPPTALTGITPQLQQGVLIDDKNAWNLLSFTYTATGGEEYMTIGNFKSDAATNLFPSAGGSSTECTYYLDDFSVELINDATITPVAPVCNGAAAFNLTGTDPGGTWSGTGITNTSNGTFDPAMAGVGTHTITYSFAGPCGDTQTEDIVVNNCALPIELLEFDAQAVDHRKVALTWTTANEINNDYFEIERSKDGTAFNTIAWADGAGNSNTTLHYNDFDLDPYNGISYYRLKQTDFDGTYTYSDIRTVIFDDLTFVNMHPNPATEDLQFTVLVSEDADLHVHIVDVMGRVIMQEDHFIEAGESTITLNVSNLASGMYTIRVNTNDENHVSKEFIRR